MNVVSNQPGQSFQCQWRRRAVSPDPTPQLFAAPLAFSSTPHHRGRCTVGGRKISSHFHNFFGQLWHAASLQPYLLWCQNHHLSGTFSLPLWSVPAPSLWRVRSQTLRGTVEVLPSCFFAFVCLFVGLEASRDHFSLITSPIASFCFTVTHPSSDVMSALSETTINHVYWISLSFGLYLLAICSLQLLPLSLSQKYSVNVSENILTQSVFCCQYFEWLRPRQSAAVGLVWSPPHTHCLPATSDPRFSDICKSLTSKKATNRNGMAK